jgi:hypothetical protein
MSSFFTNHLSELSESDSFSDSSSDLSPDSGDFLDKSVFLPFIPWISLFLTLYLLITSGLLDLPTVQDTEDFTDLSIVPGALTAYPDDRVDQSTIIAGIIGTSRAEDESAEERFNKTRKSRLKLSKLKSLYENENRDAVNLLSSRHTIEIDEEFCIPVGTGQIYMDTDETKIDYELMVANCIGLSALLPNAPSGHEFLLDMDLNKPTFRFPLKHAMLGFDPAGSMLFIGRCRSANVFLAMAPNEFLTGDTQPSPLGHSSISPLMSKRHYRQIVMMLVYFIARLKEHAFHNMRSVYTQDLDAPKAVFDRITETMYVVCCLHPTPSITSFHFLHVGYIFLACRTCRVCIGDPIFHWRAAPTDVRFCGAFPHRPYRPAAALFRRFASQRLRCISACGSYTPQSLSPLFPCPLSSPFPRNIAD